ncbi:MAG: rRNA pseudouridine synthase [Caldilineaceae bacterium]|nr:rRNA pseudouridine synthase [Caldilineaceae bacterium]
MAEERLQKVLAAAGVASRRAAEEMIAAGRVQVDGQTVTELGTKVDPALVQITVDGRPVGTAARHVYYKVNKPRGMLSDIGGHTWGRSTVAELLPEGARRVFPVGRLDLNSEGLVLLTDDGEMAHQLTHPRFEHPKTYYVLVEARPGEAALETLRHGVDLPEGRTAPAQVRIVPALPRDLKLAPGPKTGVWLEIVLREGKKRQIRHMTAAVGHPTLRLIRWALGSLVLGDLAPGAAAPLTRREVAGLRLWVAQPPRQRPKPPAVTSRPTSRPHRPPAKRRDAPSSGKPHQQGSGRGAGRPRRPSSRSQGRAK